MSVKLITLVLETRLPSSEKLLLLVLADAASEEGVCWPRQKILAARSSLSERSVRRILDELSETGLVEWERRGLGRSNVYRIDVGVLSGLAGADTVTGPDSSERTPTTELDRTPVTGPERTPVTGPSRSVTRTVKRTNADKRDAIFEAVCFVVGIDWTEPMTDSQRGTINKAVRELRTIEATTDEIIATAAAYRIRWPDIDLTPIALVKHWNLARGPLPVSSETASTARRRLLPAPPDGSGVVDVTDESRAISSESS